MDQLNTNGYILYKNVIPKDIINNLVNKCCKKKDKVNYHHIKKYIDNFLVPSLKKKLDLPEKPIYCKFRYSNNNNSEDASTFHGDIYNYSNIDIMPIYTCLSYFDDACIEIIPDTFKKSNNTFTNCLKYYHSRKQLKIPKGSILIINSQLYHRGVDFSTQGNRRLLQVFETFFSNDDYEKLIDRCYAVQTNKSVVVKNTSLLSHWASTNNTLLSYYSFIHYLLVYFDLQYKIALLDLSPFYKKDKFITYEPSIRIEYDKINRSMRSNINIICDNRIKEINPGNFYFYLLILIITIILIYKLKTKKTKSGKKGKRN